MLHTLLAGAALELWPRHSLSASGEYALDRLVAHHAHAGRVRAIAPVLVGAEFALARMRRHGIVAYYLDTTLAQQPAVAGETMLTEELAAWERFWRFRVERLRSLGERTEPGAIEAVMRQEIRSERRVP